MLNRRSLRIKAMQAIYAFKQSKESNYHIAQDLIKETFLPDLNSMEVQDKELLDKKKAQALELFRTYYHADHVEIEKGVEKDVYQAATDALLHYKNQVNKDVDAYRRQMLIEAEKIYDHYLSILLLPGEWAEMAKADRERKSLNLGQAQPAGPLNLYHNKVIERLRNSKPLTIEAIKRNIDWAEQKDNVRQWFRDIVKKDPVYEEYITVRHPSFEEDKQMLLHLAKNIIFKSEPLQGFWDEVDISWAENKAILKSMVVKTLKGVDEEGEDSELGLVELSSNWEDDREFFEALFVKCIRHDDQYEALISKKAKNWDVERIAATDKIILCMAICEMMNFPSIPVKVTINEYIEISKIYSTPKSKQFVNGILDVLAEELVEEGLIKKSGRGLIDNK